MGMIAVIYNPNAKGNRLRPSRLGNLKAILGDDGVIIQTQDASQIPSAAKKLVLGEEIDILAVCGGDGTIHKTLTAFIEEYKGEPPFLFLPLRGGAMNTIRRSVGIQDFAEQALANAVSKKNRGEGFHIHSRNCLALTIPDQPNLYGFLFGNGITANFLNVYYQHPNSGPKAAVNTIGHCAWTAVTKGRHFDDIFGKVRHQVTVDGYQLPLESFTGLLAGTIKDVGVGFAPLYRADEKPGAFHVLASALPATGLVKNVPRFFQGQRLKGENHFDFLAHKVQIKAKESFGFMIDGELGRAEQMKITAGPSVKFLIR